MRTSSELGTSSSLRIEHVNDPGHVFSTCLGLVVKTHAPYTPSDQVVAAGVRVR